METETEQLDSIYSEIEQIEIWEQKNVCGELPKEIAQRLTDLRNQAHVINSAIWNRWAGRIGLPLTNSDYKESDMTTARNDVIEIAVNLEQSAAPIIYRLLSDDEVVWHSTPFQRADVALEDDALNLVSCWLGETT